MKRHNGKQLHELDWLKEIGSSQDTGHLKHTETESVRKLSCCLHTFFYSNVVTFANWEFYCR